MIIPNAPTGVSPGITFSNTNVLRGLTPTITDAGVNQTPSNITDPDHSLTYTSGVNASDFAVSFGAVENISYVGISGHTLATLNLGTIQLFDGELLVDTVTLERNNNVMFTFDLMSFTDLKVKFLVSPSNAAITVSYICAGESMLITQGEQAGYKRGWLNRPLTQSTVGGVNGAPVSTLSKRKALSMSISLPYTSVGLSRGFWQRFLDYAEKEPFFVKEVIDLPESSYICYDQSPDFSAHSQTRVLDTFKMKFTAYNGL